MDKMAHHEDIISSQFFDECRSPAFTTTTSVSGAISACYERKKATDAQTSVLGSNRFVDNEEASSLDHGAIIAKATEDGCYNSHGKASEKEKDKCSIVKFLRTFEEAPEYLKFNPYIRRGYRTLLTTKLCLLSIFWWTNETINIWSHLFGCGLFICLAISDFQFLKDRADFSDVMLVFVLLICFCLCMLLSSAYHIFSCKSEQHYELFLSVDFFGIVLSLLAIYVSAMFYAFWCFPTLRTIYTWIALGIFALAMIIQIPKLKVSLDFKKCVMVLWALYGIIPLIHWSTVMGGMENELVRIMVLRIIIMYILCATAYFFYETKIPERWFAGKVDYVGHSHNWWHIFILLAFLHWHNTGVTYAEYRLQNGCSGIIPVLT